MLKYILAFTITACPLVAESSLGEQLETQMWEDMKHLNVSAIEKNIAEHSCC